MSTGNVFLTGANNVGTLAGTANGAFTFSDTTGVIIGEVDGSVGLNVYGTSRFPHRAGSRKLSED